MRRLLLLTPFALLLGLTGSASADHMLIKVNLTKLAQMLSGGGQGPGMGGGIPGGPPGGMIGGPPGGMIGGPPGGMLGMAGGGFSGPPGGMLGMAGGGFSGKGPGGGFSGPPGGMLGIGGGGFSGPPGGMVGMGGGMPQPPKDDPNDKWIQVFVDVHQQTHPKFKMELTHKWGKQFFPFQPFYIPAPQATFAKEYESRLKKMGKEKNFEQILFLANKALSVRATKEFHLAAEELTKIDPKHVVVKNYKRVKEALKKPITATDPQQEANFNELKRDGYHPRVSEPGHYVLYSNLKSDKLTEPIVTRRLAMMEDTFEAFYYWFALQPDLPQPAMPKYRLAAVLVKDVADFQQRHISWGEPPLVADGFTPRRDNLIIMCGRPRAEDPVYKEFEQVFALGMSALNKGGVTYDELLSGKIWDRREVLSQIKTMGAQVSMAQTLVVLHKALEDESERATTTHEVVRQLLISTELFPRHVQVPEWILSGLASYFETPIGAAYASLGVPNWQHLINFKYLRNKDKLGKSSETLYNVLTDRWFRHAHQTLLDAHGNNVKDDEKLLQKANDEMELARATSWAFVYFLAQNGKLGNLLRYGQELNQLPRDIDLNEKVLLSCYARAFDRADDKGRLDLVKLRVQSDEWLEFMKTVNLPQVGLLVAPGQLQSVETLYMNQRVARSEPPPPPPPATSGPGGFPQPGGGLPLPGGGAPGMSR